MPKKIISVIIFTLLIFQVSITTGNFIEKDDYKFLFEKTNKGVDTSVDIKITKPEKAFYINDNKIFPIFFTTIIFGAITVNAEVSEETADKVEFYFDGELKETLYNEPYNWYCDETANFRHTITVKAYEDSQLSSEDEIPIWIFNKKSTPKISLDKAIEILMNKILKPAESDKRSSAFILTKPVLKTDSLTSEDENSYSINEKSWFVFIDDEPQSFFSHDTRYVLINSESGDYNIYEEDWPPLINNISMFDTENLSKGNLIEIYPMLSYPNPVNTTQTFQSSPQGDYGDAPDGQYAYWNVTGQFPTLYNTSNSLFGRPGAHTINTGQETLGYTVSVEKDANDPSDPDGVPNLIDSDKDERTYVILNKNTATIALTVKVSTNAPDVKRYANILIDFDQNGKWTKGVEGKEWIVVNKEINTKPGKIETILIPGIKWGKSTIPVSPVWMRVALTRQKVNETLFKDSGGWDGSGKFDYGEIEDQLVFLMDNPPLPGFAVWWPPFKGMPPGGQPPGGGGGGGAPPKGDECECNLVSAYHMVRINCGDSRKHMMQGKNIVQSSVDGMAGLCGGQNGFNDAGSVNPPSPGKNAEQDFKSSIQAALKNAMKGVKCCDVLVIYICGHGSSEGEGIAIKDTSGRTRGMMEEGGSDDDSDDTLNGLLNNCCPPCTESGGALGDCDEPETCCHVRLIIESCYAGKNTGKLGANGRSVMRSSDDTPAWANCRGGIFTSGFVDGMNDPNGDRDGDGDVDSNDANDAAEDKVDDFNKKHGKGQEPNSESQECPCKCPGGCTPSVMCDKRVRDPLSLEWVNEIEAGLGETARFGILLGNDGECTDIMQLQITDVLPSCLEYAGNADLYINGEHQGKRPPDSQTPVANGVQLSWDLDEIPQISPGDQIHLLFDAETVEEGPNENWAQVDAVCSCDPSYQVSDSDTATVHVTGEEDTIPPITIKEVGQPNEEDGYIIWPYTPILLTATDPEPGSGVNYIYYEIAWDNNGDGIWDQLFEETVYEDTAEIYLDEYGIFWGEIELRWYAVDNAGNAENMHYQRHLVMEY